MSGQRSIVPLLPAQQMMLAATIKSDPETYVQQLAFQVHGPDWSIIHAALKKLIGAYEGFRSVVLHEGLKQPVWVCSESTYPKIAEHTCSDQDLPELLNRIRRTGFVIQKEPCIRFDWVEMPSKTCLVITNHHLLFDGWGKQQLLRDFMRLVEHPQHFLPEKLNRHWYEGWSQLNHSEAIQAYSDYVRPFESFAEITAHRTDKSENDVVPCDIPRHALEGLAKTWSLTPAETVNFAWACFAAEWTQEKNVQFGVVKQNGLLASLPQSFGLGIQTMPCQFAVDRDLSISTLVQAFKTQERTVAAFPFANPLDPIFSNLRYGFLIAFENYPIEAGLGTAGQMFELIHSYDYSEFPLSLAISPEHDHYHFDWHFNSGFHTKEQVQCLASGFVDFLAKLSQQTEGRLADISLLHATRTKPLHPPALDSEAFFAQIEQHLAPDQRVIFDHLTQEFSKGISRIWCYGDKHPSMPMLISAAWKLGIEVVSVNERETDPFIASLRAMKPPDVIFSAEAETRLGEVVLLDSVLDWQHGASTSNRNQASPNSSILCICTSGSTGEPKVVQLSLSNLLVFIAAWEAKIPWRESEVFGVLAHPAFDLGIAELIFPIWKGWEMRFIEKEELVQADLDRVFEQITAFHLVPALLENWIERKTSDTKERLVMTGGDKVPPRLQSMMQAKFPAARLFQYYGPSECTVFSAGFENNGQFPISELPLGSDFDHARHVILGAQKIELPPYQEGEITVTGPAVGLGYAGGLDTGAFGFYKEEKAYRTGDLGWQDRAGNLFFRGRQDHQIKIHGQRIQLTRIEHALAEWSGIKRWTVVFDEPILAAFGLEEGGHALPPRERLTSSLPVFAIPGIIETLPEFPLNKNGKIDVSALKSRISTEGFQKPHESLPSDFRALFEELFPRRELREGLGWYSNGLNSVDALKFSGRIKKTMGLNLPLDRILLCPALADIPHLVAKTETPPTTASRTSIKPGSVVHSAAARLFFLGESDPESMKAYWIRTGFELSTALAPAESLEQWVQMQPALALGVTADGSNYRWVQSAPQVHRIQAQNAADFMRQVDATPADDFQALTHVFIGVCRDVTWFAINVHHGLLDGLGVQQLLDTLAADFRSKTTTVLDLLAPQTAPVDTAFWRNALQSIRLHKLPFARIQPHSQACSFRKALDPAERSMLKSLQTQFNCSAFEAGFILWMQAWKRYFPNGDFATGVVVNTRTEWDENRLEAMSVNMLPIPVEHESPEAILAQWRSFSQKSQQPFSKIAELETQKQSKGTPFFNTTFTYNSWAEKDDIRALPFEIRGSGFDLSLDFIDTGDEAWFQWEFDPALFSAAAVQAMHEALFHIETGTQSAAPAQIESSALEAVWIQVLDQQGGQNALSDGIETLSFDALNERMENWRNRLEWSGSGVLPIIAQRTADHVALIMSCLTHGIPFIPIDAETPRERIAHIEALCGQTALDAAAEQNQRKVRIHPHPDFDSDLAYAIATSGSTGQPKLVGVKRSGYEAAVAAWKSDYHLNENDKSLQAASFSFDVFLGDLGRSLFQGAELILLNAAQRKDPSEIGRQLAAHRITVFETTPLVARWWMEDVPFSVSALRLLIVGSDVWKISEMQALQQHVGPQTLVISSYGLSETTIDNSFFAADPAATYAPGLTVPIGRAMGHSTLNISDEAGNTLPAGIEGLLAIGGPCVGKGYYQEGQWSHDGGTWLSADRGMQDEFGHYHFLGRADFQVKIRGQRLELQSIETILQGIESSMTWVAFTYHNGYAQELGVAHEKPLGAEALRHIRESILKNHPAYYLPSQFLKVEAWPMTRNGKIDRDALAQQAASSNVPLTDGAQATDLLGLFNQLFHREASPTDNFFALGRSSFDAMHFVREWNRQNAQRLEVYHLFACETFGSLAEILERTEDEAREDASPAGARPANRAQEAIWVDMMGKDDSLYNLPQFVRIPETEKGFKSAAEATLKSCPELFVRFDTTSDGTLMQHPVSSDSYALPERELTRSEFESFKESAFFHSIPLREGPAFEAELLHVEGERHLYFNPHHLVFDGGSDGHLATLYQAVKAGKTIAPTPEARSKNSPSADWSGYFQLGAFPPALSGNPANRIERNWVERLDSDALEACQSLQSQWKTSGAVVYGLALGEALHQCRVSMPWISLVMDTRSVPSVGMHMRAFPFPTGIASPWNERIGRGKEALKHLFKHQHAHVVYPNGVGHAPYHQVGLVIQHPVQLADGELALDGMSRPRLPLTLYVETISDQVLLRWEYDSGYFKEAEVIGFSRAYLQAVQTLAANSVEPAPFQLVDGVPAAGDVQIKSDAPWAALWKKYVPDSDHPHFFQGGGTSLKALLFLKELKTSQQLTIPPTVFFRSPNWETLDRFASLKSTRQDLFWELKSGTDAEATEDWYFPPIMGLGLVFNSYPLTPGHRSVAFHYPASLGEETPYESIEELADLLLAAYQSSGALPQRIGRVVAYSMGGIVAFEVIKRLEQAGVSVGSLVVWDKPAQKLPPESTDPITSLRPALVEMLEQFTEEGLDREAMVKTLLKHENLIEQYHQLGLIHCPIHVFYCPDGFDWQAMEDWRAYSTANVAFQEIATSHDEIPVFWQQKGSLA